MSFDSSYHCASAVVVEVHHDDDAAISRLVISGDMEAESADRVREALAEALRRHRPIRIDMDVRGLTFLDSAGIRVLIMCQADARQAGAHIVLVNTPPMIHRVLEITGLLEHFGVTRPHDAEPAAPATTDVDAGPLYPSTA